MPKISLIIPVYKVENLLQECLTSIIAQTFLDWECLLIDDGSPDRSGDICEEFASKDKRFKVFHQRNKGASAARNLGIQNALGDWIAFVDSDDIVKPKYLEHLLRAATSDDILVISNYVINKDLGRGQYLSDFEICSYFIENNIFALSGPYAKLFNKKVVLRKELYFPEGINMGEDAIFILRYLNVVSNVAIVNQLDYIVRHTEGSLSSKYYSFDSEYLCYKEWRRLLVKFFSRWKSESEAIALAWGNRVEGQFRRAMLSVYRSGKYHSIKEQIECLVKIDEKDLYEYRRYAKPDKWRRKLNWWLICHRLFLPYCLLGKMDRYYEK